MVVEVRQMKNNNYIVLLDGKTRIVNCGLDRVLWIVALYNIPSKDELIIDKNIKDMDLILDNWING